MGKIIFLIETENSKFLVIKRKKGYELPALIKKHELSNQHLEEKIKDKYNLDIDSIIKVDETQEYILLKCRLRCEYDKQKYKEDILNNIIDALFLKYQKNMIEDIKLKIETELLNDAIWLGVLLRAKTELNNPYLKTIITSFVLFNSTIFCDEVLNYGFGELKNKDSDMKTLIKKLRNYYLKEFPSTSSRKTSQIMESMGITLNKYNFDICIYVNDNEIIDVNSRMWDDNLEKNYELYNGIALTPKNWVKNKFPALEEKYEQANKFIVEFFKKEFQKINVKHKIYSSYKLLDKKLDENSKVYILQRIGLLKTTMLISNMFLKK